MKESVKFKAENPHSFIPPNSNDHNNEYSRYLIQNSKEIHNNEEKDGGVTDDGLKQAVSVVEKRQDRASPDQPRTLVSPPSE